METDNFIPLTPFTPQKKLDNKRLKAIDKSSLNVCKRFFNFKIQKLSEFSNLKLITQGSRSHIYSAYLNKKKCIIKASVYPFKTPKESEYYLRKIKYISSCDSPFVLKHYFCFVELGLPRLVTEYCCYGSLKNVLLANNSIPPGGAVLLFRHLAEGLLSLHSRRVIHGDICASNVFVGARLSLKLGDLGLSKIESMRPRRFEETGEGHVEYKAPEQLKTGKASKASDVFSLGLLFIRVLQNRTLPSAGETFEAYRKNFVCEHEIFGELITKMLRAKPSARLEAADVCLELKEIHCGLLREVRGNGKMKGNLFDIVVPPVLPEKRVSRELVDFSHYNNKNIESVNYCNEIETTSVVDEEKRGMIGPELGTQKEKGKRTSWKGEEEVMRKLSLIDSESQDKSSLG